MFSRTILRHARPATRSFSTTPSRPLAKIQLIGNLAASPELTATSTGHEMVKYSLATSSGPKDNRQTSWWRVAAFVEAGARRDFLLGLEKGTLLYVEGDAKMDSWEDAEGKMRSALRIVHRE
jgi:single stranded DNA-binding protein